MILRLIPLIVGGLLWGQIEPSWQPMTHPASEKAMAVNLEADGDDLIMSWILPSSRHEGQLQMARYHQGAWQPTITIVQSDRLFINWADIPKVLLGQHLSIAVWPEMMGTGTYEYGLRYKTSGDRGLTWSAANWLHDDQTPSEHGFVSLVKLPQDQIGAVWLDGRAMVAGHGSSSDHHGHGTMQLRYREISQKGLGAEVLLDDMTCECCGTDLVLHQQKPVAVYRDRSKNHIRDIRTAFKMGPQLWKKHQIVSEDGWEIHGCPVNGPALAQNNQGILTAWFTMAEQKPKIRLAYLPSSKSDWQDLGSWGKHPLGRVDISFLDPQHFILTWLETDSDQDAVYYAIFQLGDPFIQRLPAQRLDTTATGRASGFPKTIAINKRCFIAYQAPDHPGIKLQQFSWAPPSSPK